MHLETPLLRQDRKPGQGGDADHQPRDLRAELLRAEAAHFAKTRGGIDAATENLEPTSSAPKRQLENGSLDDNEDDLETKRQRILEETRDIDADSAGSSDGESSEDDR
jgi:protein CWC15